MPSKIINGSYYCTKDSKKVGEIIKDNECKERWPIEQLFRSEKGNFFLCLKDKGDPCPSFDIVPLTASQAQEWSRSYDRKEI